MTSVLHQTSSNRFNETSKISPVICRPWTLFTDFAISSTNDFYQLAVLKLRRSQKCHVGFTGPYVGFTSPKCILGAGCKLLTWPVFLFGETLCEFLNNEEGWKVAKQIFRAYFIQTTNDICMNSVTILIYLKLYMGVSNNRGTPKWMVYNGKP